MKTMKILHTSDWHIGRSFYENDRTEEFLDFFRQLHEIIAAEKPDAMLVSGDVFDNPAPSNAYAALYNRELARIQRDNPGLQTIVTAGNHDSPSRLASSDVLWKEFGVTVVTSLEKKEGVPDLEKLIVPVVRGGETVALVLAVPYIPEGSYPPVAENDGYQQRVRTLYANLLALAIAKRSSSQPVIAMGHLALSNCDLTGHNFSAGGLDSIPTDTWGDGVSYVALGHIHHAQHIGRENVRYGGSVIPLSFDENYRHSVTIVEFEGEKFSSARKVEIKPLREVLTYPENPVSFEDLKKALAAFPDGRKAYIRANLMDDGLTTSARPAECIYILKDKEARFCGFKRTVPADAAPAERMSRYGSLDEIRNLSEMDVARQGFETRNGMKMSEELEACMKEAVDAVKSGDTDIDKEEKR